MTSLAAFRDQRSSQLRKLAEQHMQHDLTQSDRDTLRSAGNKIGTHAKIGSILGLGLGIVSKLFENSQMETRLDVLDFPRPEMFPCERWLIEAKYCAVRLRTMRLTTFNAFRTLEKPVEVRFADGRTAPVPDITSELAPSKWGDAATFFFFSLGGLFFGGETGFFTGTASASRTIAADPGAKERIEKAFRNYQLDVLKQQVRDMESKSQPDSVFG